MAKASKAADTAPVEETQAATQSEPVVKVEIVTLGTIIFDHHLAIGTIIELTDAEIDHHREHGIALVPVNDDDEREVYDIRAEV